MIRLVSWNMDRRQLAWDALAGLHADVALLQEASRPEASHALAGEIDAPEVWETTLLAGRGRWRTAVVRLSDRVELERRPTVTLEAATSVDAWVVSRAGSISAAEVLIRGASAFTAVSVYAAWETAGRGYADGSAHRILSDLSTLLMGRPAHRLIVAGDWNVLRGYGENGSGYWKARYDTVFDRADALGLRFVGPEHPNGRQADPWPDELPADSLCLPTFHRSGQRPETATRQLDFVFASASIADRVTVRALNAPDEWGPSDHCRTVIDVDP